MFFDADSSLVGLRKWVAEKQGCWLPPVRNPSDIVIDEGGRWQGQWSLSSFAWQQLLSRVDLVLFSQVKRMTSWLGNDRGNEAVHEPMRQWLRSLFLIYFSRFAGLHPLLDEREGRIVAFSKRRPSYSLAEICELWYQASCEAGLQPCYGLGYERAAMVYFREERPCWRAPDDRCLYLAWCGQWSECHRECPRAIWLLIGDSAEPIAWVPYRRPGWPVGRLDGGVETVRCQLGEFLRRSPETGWCREQLARRARLPFDGGLGRLRLSGYCRSNPVWKTSVRLAAQQQAGKSCYAASCELWRYLRPYANSPTMWRAAEELAFQVLFGASGEIG